MKFDLKVMVADAINRFFRDHVEVIQKSGDQLTDLVTNAQRTYAIIGIEYGIRYIMEQMALKKPGENYARKSPS